MTELGLVVQDQDQQRPLTAAAAKHEAEMADKDLAKLIVLTPSRKNGLDSKSGSHHAASALTEGLRLFDEVLPNSHCYALASQGSDAYQASSAIVSILCKLGNACRTLQMCR